MRDTHTHVPAASPQEASLLPAIVPGRPGHITMPLNSSHFVSVDTQDEAAPRHQGSAAGRAILHTSGVNLPGVGAMRCTGRRRVYLQDEYDRPCCD